MNELVCFLSPPSRSFNHFRPPVALMYLAGYLEKKGCPSEIVDVVIKEQVRDEAFQKKKKRIFNQVKNKTLSQVRRIKPDIVGITCYTPEYFEVLELAKEVKKINKEIKIIVGGVHPTFYPEHFCFQGSPFDVAAIGEGEQTMLELVKALRQQASLRKIDGIAFFDKKKKKLVVTKKRDLEQDLDSLSFPAYDKINMDYYTTANPYAIRGVFLRSIYVLYSRGCPSQCTFCVAKKLRTCNGVGNYVRLRHPQKVFQEIAHLKEKYKIDSFYFIDDLFTLNKQKVREFCRLLIKSDLNLLWGCSSKVTTVDYQTLKMMRKAGCIQMDFGVERGSDEALRFVKKGITLKIIKKVFKDCHRLGIRTFANMLINIPEETEKDLKDIVNLLEEIKPTIVSLNTFTPYPGTEIFDDYSRRFSKKDYPLMMEDPGWLTKKYPKKFRFAKHDLDFQQWAGFYYKKFNQILPNLEIYLSPGYLSLLFNSKNKLDYVRQFGLLTQEFINQKFA